MKFCECNCGQEVRNRFVSGHNFKLNPTILRGEKNGFYGRIHSDKSKKLISDKGLGRKQSEETKNKRIETRKSFYFEHPEVLKETGKKISNTLTGRKLSEEHKVNVSINNGSKRPEVRKKIRESVKTLWENSDYRNRQVKSHTGKKRSEESLMKWARSIGLKPNKLETEFDVILQSNVPKEWKYVGDGYTWIAGKCPDWLNVNGKKKLIEMFGNYFHKPEEEEIRRNHFKKYGFDTLIIWEKEFRKNPDLVVEKVRDFTYGGN